MVALASVGFIPNDRLQFLLLDIGIFLNCLAIAGIPALFVMIFAAVNIVLAPYSPEEMLSILIVRWRSAHFERNSYHGP